ncbi:MAG: PilT/PilU family type 4a pilus ATPase [Candidatus Omnitrophica bacterium]|nr:PilT/PilU family type 4a pilus ATPase [Candidatus Omnitrophota bacterium]
MPAEKKTRKSPRRKIRIPVMLRELSNEQPKGPGIDVRIRDLSADGIGFYSQQIYNIDTILYVEMYLPRRRKPVACKIKIVHVKAVSHSSDYAIGASFEELSVEDRQFISVSLDQMDLYLLLESMIKGGASDLHLTVGRPPMVRREGRILAMAAQPLEEGEIEAMLYPLLSDEQIEYFKETKELDTSFSPNIRCRFRLNMHWQKGFVEATLRNIPAEIKSFEELGLPKEQLEKICQDLKGLFLIAGVTGSGKTTTMSSMIEFINQTQKKVIITVEDPIEYTFQSQQCIIKQRELGSDTRSYVEALKHGLRQDPDILCIGEILDAECLKAALRAAETGHFVISTIHAPDTVSAIERVVNLFPPEHAMAVRQQLASSLTAVLFQSLLPGKERKGRVLGSEFLINTNAVKHLIREGKYPNIMNTLQTGRSLGMYTFQNSLEDLVKKDLIDQETVTLYASRDYTPKSV